MSISETKVDEISLNLIIKTVFSIKILISIFIIIITVIIATVVSNKISVSNTNKNRKIVIAALSNIVFYLIIFIGFLIALLNAGFQIGSIIVILSSMGIALALGVQNIITQFISGLIITFKNMYNLNDYIITNETEGIVTEFSLLTTTLVNDDNISITIPNDKIANSNVTNITKKETVRIRVYFTIKNQPDLNIPKFIDLIKKTTALSKYIIDKNIVVAIDNISHIMGTKFVVMGYINSHKYEQAKLDIKYLILRVLSNSKLLTNNVNILLNEKEIEKYEK
jgi:small-conductance mechanosensitive channel